MTRAWIALALVAACRLAGAIRADEPRPLFDGKTLAGWETPAAEAKWWRVADGAIVGGSLEETVPHNTFLATREAFADFELQLEIRIEAGEGFVNSGVQIRSTRVPQSHEMCGYQVDAGAGWWGKLYDESRRNTVIAEPADQKAVAAAVKEGDWNHYRIVAAGPRIRSWVNGVPALDYTEQDPAIPRTGHIGLQVHGGGKLLVRCRNISIRPLSDQPPAGPRREGNAPGDEAGTPAAEAATFVLPPGFTAELVMAECTDPGNTFGKFVALAFDRHGRLWTTTALEYPLDANEAPEASRRLFAAGGRDKVLVVDDPWAAKPAPPRVFAAGLAMPLGVLPHRDGAFVQYGTEIRFYRDTDGDGRADGHEIVLDGFGTQDSHLFPHQFTRVPGGWILLAQGLFNTSRVRRPGGLPFADGAGEVRFDACKLARFKADGSMFEPLTAGPNNIWGLTISRTGETWLQEANDLGYPIFPYEPGVFVTTGSVDRLKSYQPLMPPPLAPPQMGGTGLSGLAVADDLDGWPAPWGAAGAKDGERVFYVANAITNAIQSIVATRQGDRHAYRKGPDLLTSGDKAFRPVALQFGPDGCLYVVDWYNKIISHNEVPRSHPDRDKIRGRIWRIRHASQPIREPVAVAAVAAADLPLHLGAKNARIADLAWQEIVDRDARSLVPRLAALAGDAAAATAARVGALWALEGLHATTPGLLATLAADSAPDLRHEAVRIAAETVSEGEFRAVAGPLVDDPSPRVRAALGDALRRIKVTESETVALLVTCGRGRVEGDEWAVYDRDFERFLARWAMEKHAGRVASLLDSPAGSSLPVENRLLALQAIDPPAAARALVRLLPDLGRPPANDEIVALAMQAEVPEVAAALERIVCDPAIRGAALRALLAVHTSLPAAIEPIVSRATADLLGGRPLESDPTLDLELAGTFKLRNLEAAAAARFSAPTADEATKRAAVRALREMGAMSAETARRVLAAAAGDARLRDAAVAAWAASRDPGACAALVSAWDELTFAERQAAAGGLARHREGARALVGGLEDESIDVGGLPITVLADMRQALGADAALERIWAEVTARAPQVLRFAGGNADAGPTVNLVGPFTVEAWVNLEAPVGNEDSLLAADDVVDVNFCEGHLSVWTKAHGDVVIAKSRTMPDTWTHYAVTRDADGGYKVYIDGEWDADGRFRDASPYRDARVGFSTLKAGGTRGRIAEFRVWDRARTADEIRADFDRSYLGDAQRPASLVAFHGGGSWGETAGGARVEPALDAPALITAAEIGRRAEKFTRFRELAAAAGDPTRGQAAFASRCLTCHQQGGQGGRVGPALDGIGLVGVEAILRNVLTPNAAMEGGYRTFRVVTRDGRIVQGLLVSQDADAIVIRQPNTADSRIPSRDVAEAGFTSVSLMPEGLLESMPPQEVSDLFAYLKTLGAAPKP